ncbi:MAG: LysR family transcriptional regulator [Nocardioides sp.]|uniref:LysR family transcriptional regulator n=1 Tax=Nocardioides sp. TaxID=35761 RepID=UPI0039E4B682
MTNSLDIEHLRTLIAIAECGGFSKAATVRHLSQPALSQHVRLLERGLKRKLFVKDGRQMRFTAEGDRVLAEARHLVEMHDEVMRRLAVEQHTAITVGSTEHAAEQVLPEMLRVIRDAFPDATTRFEIGRSTRLADEITRGTLDLAFVLDPSGSGAGHEVGQLPLHWYAAPGWTPPEPGRPLHLVAFEEPCGLREQALQLLSAAGRMVEVTAQSSTLEGVLAGVRAGLGVALLPSAGGRPFGLTRRRDLPTAGTAALRLIARRGLDPAVAETARIAGETFFSRPALALVPQSPGA